MKRFLIALSILFAFLLKLNAQNEPTISTCIGQQTFCLTQNTFDLCVEITLNSGFTDPIDHFEIDWGDNSPVISIPFSTNPTVSPHTYDFSTFFNTCNYDEKYFIELTTFIVNGNPVANIIPVTFINPPQAMFSINPQIICVGEEACFDDDSCPTEGLNIVSWDYGDGSPSGIDECHTYNQTGTYSITLEVMNNCGSDFITQQLQVINPPEANIAVVSNNIDISTSPFIYCLGSGIVELSGDSLSLNENAYEWLSLNNYPGASWVLPPNAPNPNDATPNIPDLAVSFSDTGLYQLILEVNNECDQPDLDTIMVQVLSGEALSQPNQSDACLELIYTPENYNQNATYMINGNVQTAFPVTLVVGTYEVICSLTNECGSQSTIDNFEVFGQEDVSITFPSSDTTLCLGTDSIMILYEPFGGTWSGEHLTFSSDSVFFHPNELGAFEITYSKGATGTACEDSESFTITVEDSGIEVLDYEICSWSPSFQMQAMPSGGTYSSTDCPLCIQGDTFIISEMVALGLSMVEINYESASATGCEGSNIFTVEIDDPIAMFEVADTFCLGDLVTIDFSNTNGTLTWMVDGQVSSPPPFSNLSGGFHTIKLTAAAGDCEVEFSKDIFITAPPMDVSFLAMPLEGCADLEVSLTNTTTSFDDESYEWYINDSLFSTAIQPETITLGQGFSDTTYIISLSAGNSCSGQFFEETITVFPRPIPRFGTEKNNYCSGDTVCFYNVSLGSPITSWLWDYGNGATSTDSLPLKMIYFTDTIPTTYTISLTATNMCGTETFTYDLVVNPTDVQANFNTNPVQGCVGVPICFTNFSTVGANVFWDFGDGNTSTQSDICHTYQQAGTYIIKLKAFGCGFDSVQQSVVIHPRPIVNFENNSITCPNDTVSFTNLTIGADNYVWDFGDGNTSMLNHPTHIYNTPGTYTISLIGTSTQGCLDSTFSSITILTPPQADFIVSIDSVCVGDNILFTSSSTPNPLTCYWEFGDGNFSTDCSPVYAYSTSGSFIVSLIVTNNDGCRDTAQQLVYVSPIPEPDFDFVKNQDCSPIIVSLINLTNLGESYFWDFGDGNSSIETTPVHTYSLGGNYSIQLTATNGVCSQSMSKVIEINLTPDANIITPLETGCAPFDAGFTSSPSGNNFIYKWDFGDGTFSFDEAPNHEFNFPNAYEVILVVEDSATGCADTTSTIIEVFEPVAGTIATTDNLCFEDMDGTIDLSLISGTADFEYDWSNGADTSSLSNLPAGNYSFTITDNNGCTWSEAIVINQPDSPISIEILQEQIVTCYGGSDGGLTIAAQGGTPDYGYQWSSGNTSTEISSVPAGNYDITITDSNGCVLEEILTVQQNDSINYLAEILNISCFGFDDGEINLDSFSGGVPPYFATLDTLQGTGFNGLSPDNYSVVISDGLGCTQILNANIIEPPEIWIKLNADSTSLFLGDIFPITSTYNVSTPLFTWTPIKGLDCEDCDSPIARPFHDITYEVVLTDEKGCTASDEIFIKVNIERGIAIPNIFTPNNDGQNDVFTLLGNNPAVVEVVDFKIFDRYGGVMFEAQNFELNNSEFGWDGKFNNIDAQVGQYVYQAIVQYVDDKTETFKGSVMLSR